MPRKTRRPPPFVLTAPAVRPSRAPVWLGYLLTAVIAGGIGAGGTYLAVRPALQRGAALQAEVNAAQAASSSGPATAPGVPPSALTAGLDPAHAALNLGNWYEDQGAQAEAAGHQTQATAGDMRAIANYSLAIADGLDAPDIRTDLGVAYYKSGQPQKALEQYQHAQQQNPQHENSLFNQGAALAVQNKIPQAIAVWQSYLKRFPQGQHVADAHQLIAEIQAHGGPNTARRSAAP